MVKKMRILLPIWRQRAEGEGEEGKQQTLPAFGCFQTAGEKY